MTTKELASRIKLISKEKGCAVSKLLTECGINRNFIYDLEHTESFPAFNKLEKIANYFDISVDYLLGKEKSSSETEELENVVSWHRDGKTTVKQLTKEEMKLFEKMMEAMGDDTPDYL